LDYFGEIKKSHEATKRPRGSGLRLSIKSGRAKKFKSKALIKDRD